MVGDLGKGTVLDTASPDDEEITTGVDQLLKLLKTEPKIALSDAAKKLNVSLDVVQSWVDFLVEEHIVGIEYKFTKPFIYLNQPGKDEKKKPQEEPQTFVAIKKDFMEKAQEKNIPNQNAQGLWENHVKRALEHKKKFFVEEATKRKLKNIEALWGNYEQKVMKM